MKKNERTKKGVFYLQEQASPTYYNLAAYLKARGWQACSSREGADFSEENLAFSNEAALCLEYKHLLANLVLEYCPLAMPVTYGIDDHSWPLVLNHLKEHFYEGQSAAIDGLAWILKPSMQNNGQNIKIFRSASGLLQHYSSSKRLGGAHVLQQYITNPHLLRGERKFSIRQFVVLTSYNGAYLYRHGYFNVAMHPYKPDDVGDLKSHLTNEHLFGYEPNVIQIPSSRFETHPLYYPQIKAILTDVFAALRQRYPFAFVADSKQTFAIFGMDFMVDASARVWLLEANHGPCFPVEDGHPLQTCLYRGFWEAVIDHFVLPIAGGNREKPEDARDFDVV